MTSWQLKRSHRGLLCGLTLLLAACGGTPEDPNPDAGTDAGNDAGCEVAVSCESREATCGSIPDGCGGTLECGTCDDGMTCAENRCGSDACTPSTCAELGKSCGSVPDGCGGTLTCGTCADDETCTNGTCACEGAQCHDDAELTYWGLPLWRDEFDASALESWWYKMPLPYSGGNKESQWYRPENLEVYDGTLKIISRKQDYTGTASQAPYMSMAHTSGINYAAPRSEHPAGKRFFTSGLINTRDATDARFFPLYGRYEIRARLPHGQGLLPAFWLRRKGGAGYGEVDIMESFGNYKPGYGKFSLHFPNTTGTNRAQQSVFFETAAPGTGGWHTWAMEITPTGDPTTGPISFKAFLDGVEYGSYVVDDTATLDMLRGATPDETWDIALNTAVGGRWVGEPDQQLGFLPIAYRCSKSQAAPPAGGCNTDGLFFATLPATFEIDYVRVYALP